MTDNREHRGEQLATGLGALNAKIEENRVLAGAIAVAGLMATTVFWGVALLSPEVLGMDIPQDGGRFELIRGLAVWFVVFMGAAEGTFGALNFFGPGPVSPTSYEAFSGLADATRSERRRRTLLLSILAGLVNVAAMALVLS